MPLYEHVFIARQDISPQQVEALTETLKGVIAAGGGSVGKTEYWGLKSMTYRIRKNRKGHYSLMNIDAPPAAVAELERQEKLSEDVLRYLTVRVEELEAGESAMLRSRGARDDRRDDRRGGGRPRRDDRPRDDRPPREDGREGHDRVAEVSEE